MNRLVSFIFVAFVFLACSETSNNSSNEEDALLLNSNCKEFEESSDFCSALSKIDLDKIKKGIEECSSLSLSYCQTEVSAKFADFDAISKMLWQESSEKDSAIIYLLSNGMDSSLKANDADLIAVAMSAQDTNIVRFAMDLGYPITGQAVAWAIFNSFDFHSRYWYEELISRVQDINSVSLDYSIYASDFLDGREHTSMLASICSGSDLYISDEDKLYFFKDLIDRGYSVNVESSGVIVPLQACNYGTSYQTELQKELSQILIEAGADTTCFWVSSRY